MVYACSSIKKEDSAFTQYDREIVGYNDLPKYPWDSKFNLENFKTKFLDRRNIFESRTLEDVIRSGLRIGYNRDVFEKFQLTDGKTTFLLAPGC